MKKLKPPTILRQGLNRYMTLPIICTKMRSSIGRSQKNNVKRPLSNVLAHLNTELRRQSYAQNPGSYGVKLDRVMVDPEVDPAVWTAMGRS